MINYIEQNKLQAFDNIDNKINMIFFLYRLPFKQYIN